MSGDFDNIAKSFMTSPQGIKIIKGLDKFNSAMSTENGKQLLQMLASGGSEAIRISAAAAAEATKDPGRIFISTLLSTKEGAALTGKVIEVLGV